MVTVIGVKFRNVGKLYYFDPGDFEIRKGDKVIVETVRGIECGDVGSDKLEIAEENVVKPLKTVIRKADENDVSTYEENRQKEKDAFTMCQQKISEHKLGMKLVDVEYAFDGSKILFYFTADGRVDFRELVKDLAGVFRTRIELRQIGVRDESKILGGIGICGQTLCCSTFLFDFQPVSIKMAKEQGKSLNPIKISGACGRLMCCLKYEQNVYDELIKNVPRNGTLVKTPNGNGTIIDSAVLAQTVRVRMGEGADTVIHSYAISDIQILATRQQLQQGRQNAKEGSSLEKNDTKSPEPQKEQKSLNSNGAGKPRRSNQKNSPEKASAESQ